MHKISRLHHFADHLPEFRARIAQLSRETRGEMTVREFAAPMHATGAAYNSWERGVALPNPYLYFYAAEAGGPQALWAVRCLEALGLLPALKKLAEAADQYQHSTE